MPIAACAAAIAVTAWLSERLAARLKLMVTAGNCCWRCTASGAVRSLDRCHGTERDLRTARRGNVDAGQRGRIVLERLHRLQHDAILVGLRIDGRDLPLPETVVEGVVDRLHRDAEPAGDLAVDPHECAQAAVLGLRDDVAQHGGVAHLVDEPLRPVGDFLCVAAGQRVLILPAAQRAC